MGDSPRIYLQHIFLFLRGRAEFTPLYGDSFLLENAFHVITFSEAKEAIAMLIFFITALA